MRSYLLIHILTHSLYYIHMYMYTYTYMRYTFSARIFHQAPRCCSCRPMRLTRPISTLLCTQMERTANALRTEHDRRDQLTRQSVRTVKQRTPLPGAKCPTCHEVVGVPHRGEAERASTASAAGMSKGRTEGGQPPVRPTTADAAPGRPATPPSRPVTPITRPSTAKTQAGAGATPRGAALRGSAGMSRSVGAPSGGPRGAHWEAIDRAGATGSIDFSSEASAMLESSASWAESSPARRASVAAPGALAAKMSSVFLEVDAASAAKMAKKLQL